MVHQLRTARGRTALAAAAACGAWYGATALTVPVAAQTRAPADGGGAADAAGAPTAAAVDARQVIEALKRSHAHRRRQRRGAQGFRRPGAARRRLGDERRADSREDAGHGNPAALPARRVDALRAALAALQGQISQMAQARRPSLDPLIFQVRPRGRPRRTLPAVRTGQGRRRCSNRQVRLLRQPVHASLSRVSRRSCGLTAHGSGQRGPVLDWRDLLGSAAMDGRHRRLHAGGAEPSQLRERPRRTTTRRAYESLGQSDAARASWSLVIKTYPDSTPATLAKQGLDRLSRKTTP